MHFPEKIRLPSIFRARESVKERAQTRPSDLAESDFRDTLKNRDCVISKLSDCPVSLAIDSTHELSLRIKYGVHPTTPSLLSVEKLKFLGEQKYIYLFPSGGGFEFAL